MTALTVESASRMDEIHDSASVAVIGGGACGLTAALAARDAGIDVLLIERDAQATGSTELTWGMVPGAGTRYQRELGIDDTAELFAADILKKAGGKGDPAMALAVAKGSGSAVEWLADTHGLEFQLLDDVLYPGHSRHRYHVPMSRTGAELQLGLLAAARDAGVRFLLNTRVSVLYQNDDQRITALGVEDGSGRKRIISCDAAVLASGGYGAAPSAISHHIPDMKHAVYCGHHGSQGDALAWGEALGAASADLSGYQGHCVADALNLPLTWTVIIEGGIQVNTRGRRFSNEMSGYSEQASAVLAQPDQVAFTIYDERCETLALRYSDYQRVVESGAVLQADTIDELARKIRVPADELAAVFDAIARSATAGKEDEYGRIFLPEKRPTAPYRAVKVRGALFHTQGGLCVDDQARVLRSDKQAFPNLFAGGGAARGMSGPDASGYLGGNGLVTAVVLGRLAGSGAARTAGALT